MPPMDSNNTSSSVLKNTREAKGLTLEIVHEATKIPMDALRAIEEGYSVRILSPFYYKGFIKIYAEFLGLNASELYAQYGLDTATKIVSSVTSTTPLKPAHKSIKPKVFLDALPKKTASVFKPKIALTVLKILGFVLVVFLVVKTAGYLVAQISKKGTHAHRVSSIKTVKNIPESSARESLSAHSENNHVQVAVRASRNIWLLVKADGKIVFEMTLTKGSMESWSADKRIELSGRDIAGLDMEVNNKHIGLLGTTRRIKKVVITPEGLTVKK